MAKGWLLLSMAKMRLSMKHRPPFRTGQPAMSLSCLPLGKGEHTLAAVTGIAGLVKQAHFEKLYVG